MIECSIIPVQKPLAIDSDVVVYLRPAAKCVEHVKEDKASERHCCISRSDHIILHLQK